VASSAAKLILYAGGADPLIPSPSTINYFNALAQTTFGAVSVGTIKQTQQFARLFMAPGMWHCQAAPGPNSFGGMIQQPVPFDPQHDILNAFTQWVEKGIAPTSVIATKYTNDTPQSGIQMQRPLCLCPQIPQVQKGREIPRSRRISNA
jgi:feruloyl esterase